MSAVPVGKGLSGSSTARIAGPSGPGWGWEGPAPTAMSRSLSLTCSPRKCCPAPWASPGPFPPGAPGPHSARSLRAPALPRHATMHHNVPRRTRSRSPGHLRSRAPNDTFDWLVNRKDRENREGSTSNQLWEAASSSPKPATTCSNNASANNRPLCRRRGLPHRAPGGRPAPGPARWSAAAGTAAALGGCDVG